MNPKFTSTIEHKRKTLALEDTSTKAYQQLCLMNNIKCFKASDEQDIKNHIDFFMDGESVDVKGMKDSSSAGNILIEIKNVNGRSGWCNNAKHPEWIAFYFGAFFLHVYKKDLYQVTNTLCDLENKVPSALACLYKGYTRKNRKDLLTMVKLQDVLNTCNHWFLANKIK